MHSLFLQASELTHDVIGAAIAVHKDKGVGLLEAIYEWCSAMKFEMGSHKALNQNDVIVRYKQFQRPFPLRFCLLADKCLFVEAKAAERIIRSTNHN